MCVPGQGVGSKGCKCNCDGFGYQTSMLYVVSRVGVKTRGGYRI